MNVLHIANYYIGAKVYKNLASAIDKLDVYQTVYTAFAEKALVGANKICSEKTNVKIIYRPILDLYTRLNYYHKTKKLTRDILTCIHGEQFDCIHAHTLFSDGRVAYNLNKIGGTPYIITIRNTDLNFFFRYFLHLRMQAKETLLSSEKIIFISDAYRKRLLSHPYFADCKEELSAKSITIPNGIDEYWLKNVTAVPASLHSPARLLYVGKITKGKNLHKVIDAAIKLNTTGTNCVVHVAGTGSNKYAQAIYNKIEENSEFISYHGKISDQSILLNLYRSCDVFVMPSRTETFGLVYVEALSQGKPVVYTQNEGIDGFFSSQIGEAVNCNDELDIYNKILKILNNYSHYSFNSHQIVSDFDWNVIAQKYLIIYNSALSAKSKKISDGKQLADKI